jgi:membrane-anchored protein YejM (alkaline phosphatase superfamily)
VYDNIVDTHFPYTHSEVDDMLGSARLSRENIRSSHADEVFRACTKTARNVDHAVERVITSSREAIRHEDHGILITADHSQAFYENGMLGHDQSLQPLQTQVAFILWGIGGEWPHRTRTRPRPPGATGTHPTLGSGSI